MYFQPIDRVYYLLEGLRDAATDENRDGYITVHEVFRYVTSKIRQGYPQRPTLEFQGAGDIVLLPAATILNGVINSSQRIFLTAVKETRDFFDRREEVAQIKQVLDSTTDILVILKGERCIGKTSLLNRIRNLLREEDWRERRFVHFTLGPASARTVDDFAREIWHSLPEALQDAGLKTPAELDAPFTFETFAGFAHHLERLTALLPSVTFVAFVDEFDKLAHDKNVEYKQIIGLIHYILEQTNFPLLFLVSTSKDLPESYGSPVPSRKIMLRPFSRADTDEMVFDLLNSYGRPSDDACARIYDFSGGHPYFTRLLLLKLLEQPKTNLAQWKVETPYLRVSATST